MQITRIASICVVATAMLFPCAWAEQNPVIVKLVQTVKAIIPSYPGVSTDIIGIKIGMPLAKAEAIASKNIHGEPAKRTSTFTGQYRDVSVTSQSFVYNWQVDGQNGDGIALYSDGPGAGSKELGDGSHGRKRVRRQEARSNAPALRWNGRDERSAGLFQETEHEFQSDGVLHRFEEERGRIHGSPGESDTGRRQGIRRGTSEDVGGRAG